MREKRDNMKKKIVGLIISMLLFTTTLSVAAPINTYKNTVNPTLRTDSDWWPCFGHDAANTRVSTVPGFDASSARIRWDYNTVNAVSSSAVVYENRVFIGVQNGLVCVDAITGALIWRNSTIGQVSSTPTIASNRVYVGMYYSGKVYCFDAATGAKIWLYNTSVSGGSIKSNVLVVDGKVYVGAVNTNNKDGSVYCVNASSGTLLWKSALRVIDAWPKNIGVANGKVFVASYNNTVNSKAKVYCFDADPSDGVDEGITDPVGSTYDLIWTYQTANQYIQSNPTIIEDRVYVGAMDKKMYCFDANSDPSNPTNYSRKIWSYNTNDFIASSQAVYGGKVFTISGKKLFCLNATTGNMLWNKTLTTQVSTGGQPAPSVLTDGKLYTTIGMEKKLLCLDINNNGNEFWNYSFNYSAISNSVAISPDGGVILGFNHSLLCFGPNRAPNTPSTPSGPTQGAPGINYNYVTNATDPDGDDIQYGWDWTGDNVVDQWTGFYASGESVLVKHMWSMPGTYDVWVKSRDHGGAESGFSTPLTVTLVNHPPSRPILNGPSEGVIGLPIVFTASTTDPDGHQVRYGFDWGDGSAVEWTGYFESGIAATRNHTWAEKKSFNVKVKAADKWNESDWSGNHSINIINHAPAIPTISGPTDGLIGVAYNFIVTTTDPDGHTVKYGVDWNNDGTVEQWTGYFISGVPVTLSHTWTQVGTFSVKAKASDSWDESTWSALHSITITTPANLTIGNITGGLLKVSCEIKNTGGAQLTNVSWSLNVAGGLLRRINVTGSGSESVLEGYSQLLGSANKIFGLGKITITVKAKAADVAEKVKTVEGFVFFFILQVK
jgi:outer membrane protein assembly factor BamB